MGWHINLNATAIIELSPDTNDDQKEKCLGCILSWTLHIFIGRSAVNKGTAFFYIKHMELSSCMLLAPQNKI